jgi:hypothetical protein
MLAKLLVQCYPFDISRCCSGAATVALAQAFLYYIVLYRADDPTYAFRIRSAPKMRAVGFSSCDSGAQILTSLPKSQILVVVAFRTPVHPPTTTRAGVRYPIHATSGGSQPRVEPFMRVLANPNASVACVSKRRGRPSSRPKQAMTKANR